MPKHVLSLLVLCILTTVTFCLLLLSSSSTTNGHHPRFKKIINELKVGSETGPWPFPRVFKVYDDSLSLRAESFHFKIRSESKVKNCDVLLSALSRYRRLIFRDYRTFGASIYDNLDQLEIVVSGNCETWPHMNMDESYSIDLVNNYTLRANTIWGALRGLETFSQLVHKRDGYTLVNKTIVKDYPRFKYRGLMVDTARHFIPMAFLLRNLDAMAYNKLNVFHWHLVDDQSFPYVSRTFPNLSYYGAYDRNTQVYTPKDVLKILEYARLRGIRVIVEFDTPGHTLAWAKGTSGVIINCQNKNSDDPSQPPKGFGVINVLSQETYKFLELLFLELAQTFPDDYMHLGGDEVATDCWPVDPASQYQKHVTKMIHIAQSLKKKVILWQDVYDNQLTIPAETVIQVWKSWGSPDEIVASLVRSGYEVIVSYEWYLDMISYKKDWIGYYQFEPLRFITNEAHSKLVIGGEACVWTEYIDETNFLSRTWPRASAVAERLWSDRYLSDASKASARFEAHRCLLKSRGVPAHPINGPSSCPNFVGLDGRDFYDETFSKSVHSIYIVPVFYLLLTALVLCSIYYYLKRRKGFQPFEEDTRK